MCCTRLAGNTRRKNDAKNRHLRTIAQFCRAISSQCIDNRKKLLSTNISPHMPLQYGERRPTSSWDRFISLGHPSKFQQVSRLGSVTARHSTSGRQPNCGVEQTAPPVFDGAAIIFGARRCQLSSITLSVHHYFKHVCHDVVLRAGLSATAPPCHICHASHAPLHRRRLFYLSL